ncbi:putative multidrug efflux transporter, MFS family protein [Rubellimicrobium mesophilum DSM 19309]|uniref:Putative multidrug efflux transporter, MFS family protein n=1 Tax=Rubellimicrobium mesophilum DSM 19309 TaxID=442562 RepID=A0A017HU54_9RHOB|nr:putative multidrug efflux transporter, MFS family protein [Rubellimicrobium mesophilum DSM 19309]
MQAPADLADWLDMVAVGALMAFEWRAPSVAFAWAAVAVAVPPMTLGLLAGVHVDCWPLRRTMVLSNLGRAGATLLLIAVPSWPWLVAVVALRAVADSFFSPAKQAALPALVPPERLIAANGLSQAVNQATKVAAPALGAAALLALDPRGVFAVNAAMSGLAAAIALTLPPLAPRPGTGAGAVWAELREGLGLVARSRVLRGAIGLIVASTFAIFVYDTQIAPLVRELGLGEEAFGLCLAFVGGGGLLGSLGLLGLRAGPLGIVAATGVGSGLLIAALGLQEMRGAEAALLPFLALSGAVGFLSSVGRVPLRAMVQEATPPGMMGRVAALVEAASLSALLVAPFLGAWLAEWLSVGAPFLAGGLLMIGVAAGAMVMGRRGGAG